MCRSALKYFVTKYGSAIAKFISDAHISKHQPNRNSNNYLKKLPSSEDNVQETQTEKDSMNDVIPQAVCKTALNYKKYST